MRTLFAWLGLEWIFSDTDIELCDLVEMWSGVVSVSVFFLLLQNAGEFVFDASSQLILVYCLDMSSVVFCFFMGERSNWDSDSSVRFENHKFLWIENDSRRYFYTQL